MHGQNHIKWEFLPAILLHWFSGTSSSKSALYVDYEICRRAYYCFIIRIITTSRAKQKHKGISRISPCVSLHHYTGLQSCDLLRIGRSVTLGSFPAAKCSAVCCWPLASDTKCCLTRVKTTAAWSHTLINSSLNHIAPRWSVKIGEEYIVRDSNPNTSLQLS